jgi:hypothetical protein
VAPGSGVPTGTVIFELATKKKKKITEKVLGTVALGGGSATLSVKPRSVLKKSITILYGGDADFQAGTETETLSQSLLTTMARPMLSVLRRRGG